MTQKSNPLPIAAIAISVAALGFSAWNMVELRNQSASIDNLKSSVGDQIDQSIKTFDKKNLSAFEGRVESSLESIVQKRRAQAEAERKAKIEEANAKGNDMTSMNDKGQVVYGNVDAPVSIYSYEDYRCSYCEKHHPTVKQYVEMSNGYVNYIIKPYPILGEASVSLAQAGECVAQEEGPAAFMRFVDQAYATKNWRTAISYSGLIDAEEIEKCVQESRYNDRIMDVLSEGNELNITGTPASVFRGKETGKAAFIPGFLDPSQITRMIQEVSNE